MKKRYWFLLVFIALISTVIAWNYPKLDLISGFAAKNAASCHFGDGRSLLMIETQDNDIPLVNLAKNAIDDTHKSASASVFGFKERTAIWREGLGSVLIDEDFDINQEFAVPKRNTRIRNLEFPFGDLEQKDTVFSNIDYGKLRAALGSAFDPKGVVAKRSRSVIVIYKGKIIAERYALGFSKKSKFLGWSMTKSITATLFGILEKQNRFDITKPAPIAQWQNDERKNITTKDLLNMNSGLEWNEDYETISDATTMLFNSRDMSRVQLEKSAEYKPGEHWNYSSGTSNLLSAILRKQFRTQQQYLDFWYSALIDRIGMHSMIVETDMAGNYVGSSYAWATTRDWAKFGLLYLNKGNWNGDQLFDRKWLDFVTTPTNGSQGKYGGHFWLNKAGFLPNVPRDTYSCNGFQGQRVFIIPSKDLVVVRLGLTEGRKFDFDSFLKNIIASIE